MSNQEFTKTNIQQDLRDARGLIEQAGSDEEKRKYRKAAEIILIKALRMDPDNEEASILLQSVRGVPVKLAPAPAPNPSPAPPPQLPPQPQQALRDDDLSFTATATAPPLFASLGSAKKKRSKSKVLFGMVFIIALGGGLVWIEQTHGMSSSTASTAYTPGPGTQTADQSSLAASVSEVPVVQDAKLSLTPEEVSAAPTAPLQVAETTHPAPVPAPVPAAPAPPSFGRLAVSSPTAADIYQGGKYLGSTPATLQLPAGQQTLEYRHGALRTVITHEIKADDTTSASVTFPTTVQINAKPWAHVFVDGASRRELGQTPLSGISVPIGGVLVFENPNFTSKTHRVTENDTTIQVDFH
ncbi:MAG TPA: PEGA domain-containing protein [Terriglobia bacterium]|jgi:hypothetical protein